MPTPVILGADDQSVYLRFLDSATFLEETGVSAATAGLTLRYKKGATGTTTSVTAPTITALVNENAAHTDWGIIHCADGAVRVDVPDDAVPTIENEETIVTGTATGMIVLQAKMVGVLAGETIGTGTGLSAVPWNASWDAEVQSEVADALTAYGASTYAGADTAGTTTLLSRLTATRAGYLDNLSAGAVALASALTTAQSDLTTLLSRLSAARAGYLDALATNGALIVAAVWAYATRTLTSSAASTAATVAGTTITVSRGDSWSISLTGLGNISTRSKLWLTVKADLELADAASEVQIEETAGLAYLAGAPGTAGNGSITVTNETTGALTIALQEASSATLTPGSYKYDMQMLTTASAVTTLTSGTFVITADATRATT